MKVCALIPAFNESRHIARVVAAARAHCPVLVVDDGSQDDTAELAATAGAQVLRREVNAGKGAALQAGLDHALGAGCGAAVLLDGDGQHDPADIPRFIAAARRDPSVGVIVGCRMRAPGAMPLARLLTNRAMSAIVSRLCHQTILDTQSGYRLVRAEVLRRIRLCASRFDVESEMLILACRAGFSVSEIPIRAIYADEESHISVARDTLRFAGLVWRHMGR